MNNSLFRSLQREFVFMLLTVFAVSLTLFFAYQTHAQAPAQGTLTVIKEVVGTSTPPSDFSFLINGAATTSFEADGSNDVLLDAGTYTVTEIESPDYDTVYTNCLNINLTATGTATCTITNTYIATSTPQTPATGTLVVNKIVQGGPLGTSSFAFAIDGAATTSFESDGRNVLQNMATGTYTITEVPVANYTSTYSNCAGVTVTANATSTCTITNTFNAQGGQLYEITGVVWADENRDDVRNGGEGTLENWTVSASSPGEITRTDTTDASGRYSLLVTGGTWTVSQTLQSNWEQTYPDSTTHTVQATGTASTTIVLDDRDFGNDRIESSSSGGGSGNGVRIELRDTDDDDDRSDDDDDDSTRDDDDDDSSSDDDDDDTSSGTGTFPPGAVLGEGTTVYPIGAPATGEGGATLHRMNGNATLPLVGVVLLLLAGFGIAHAIQDPRRKEEVV